MPILGIVRDIKKKFDSILSNVEQRMNWILIAAFNILDARKLSSLLHGYYV